MGDRAGITASAQAGRGSNETNPAIWLVQLKTFRLIQMKRRFMAGITASAQAGPQTLVSLVSRPEIISKTTTTKMTYRFQFGNSAYRRGFREGFNCAGITASAQAGRGSHEECLKLVKTLLADRMGAVPPHQNHPTLQKNNEKNGSSFFGWRGVETSLHLIAYTMDPDI